MPALLKTCVVTACCAFVGIAQQRVFTAADYARAEQFMGYSTTPLVQHAGVRPAWMADERLTYRITTEKGTEFVVADPGRGTRGPAFDHAKLAAALSAAAGRSYEAYKLPFTEVEISGEVVSFAIGARRWKCDLTANRCSGATAPRNESLSPDKKRAVFIRDFNLWVRDVAT